MNMLKKGNAKLGAGIFTYSLQAGASCPGKTEYCATRCYAEKVQRIYPSAREAWEENFELADADLGAWKVLMSADVRKLKTGAIVRIHVSGDFFSAAYVRAWRDVMSTRPDVRFYAYTRSWRIADIWRELSTLESTCANFRLWLSVDPEANNAPAGYRVARMLRKGNVGARGYVTCPEQNGKQPTCTACTLCFHDNVKPNAKLAFIEH